MIVLLLVIGGGKRFEFERQLNGLVLGAPEGRQAGGRLLALGDGLPCLVLCFGER